MVCQTYPAKVLLNKVYSFKTVAPYKFKKIVGNPNFSDTFEKIIKRYKMLDIIWVSCNSLHVGL